MRGRFSSRVMFVNTVGSLTLVLCCSLAVMAQSPASRNAQLKSEQGAFEQKTARYFESIRTSPPRQLAFLLRMPKGGDLHNHLSGSIYAESYIQWAADNGLCVNNQTLTLLVPEVKSTCDPKLNLSPMSTALTNYVLYRQMIDAWSMRNWQLSGQSGHDHF